MLRDSSTYRYSAYDTSVHEPCEYPGSLRSYDPSWPQEIDPTALREQSTQGRASKINQKRQLNATLAHYHNRGRETAESDLGDDATSEDTDDASTEDVPISYDQLDPRRATKSKRRLYSTNATAA